MLGKCHRGSHPTKTSSKVSKPGESIHVDTVGPIPVESLGGSTYFVVCKDEFSGYRKVFFVSSKAEIGDKLKTILAECQAETGNRPLQLASDNGTEFKNCSLQNFLAERGISHKFSVPYTPEQNGYVEREIRTIMESARTLRLQSGLEKSFWAEAVNTAVYVLNRVVSTHNTENTPYQLWFGKKPSLNNIHKFGQRAVIYDDAHQRDKLDAKGHSVIFVGYTDEYNTFRFVDPNSHRLTES